ncbi:alpha-ketoglutarate-dependent dioxygenase AlkB family protein [Kangiella koreensis]|uniref:2OG-Fe(II) oxygenase n=1 Tax=Kangiella koreensis (strain DSM 16069 / JCM 12317 / KCTC 12182 / SW-125) TaxID=523791 RepID=C7RA32_KANKD|nr:alpha-ketoglutarate-dependent dioxygenase AlkB [Kangiella koreensis]ACV26151.1 2OG-Fe(II) oxygenase [Kangiella koreensis DSM 16069]
MQQSSLCFGQSSEIIQLKDAEIELLPHFLPAEEGGNLFENLLEAVDWQSETIRIAGVERLVPRLTAWYGDKGASYTYSGVIHHPIPWSEQLLALKKRIEQVCQTSFNSALFNLYRDGRDSVAWHSDDEPELGAKPIIASLSLGAPRSLQLKHKKHKDLRHKLTLTSGSLLVMRGDTQRCWQHQVPKEPAITEPRINITFRNIVTNHK